MKIVVMDGHALNPGDLSWQGFAQLGELVCYEDTPGQLILPRMRQAQAVLVNKTPITADTLAACPRLRYIGVLATGYNHVDTAAAAARGIPVCNVPSYGTQAVAQFTFALLLELCHQVGAHSAAVQAGQWSDCPYFCFWNTPQQELAGKTMGIVGYGRIGRAVAGLARAFGMRVLAYSPGQPPRAEDGVRFASLDQLYAQADVVSLHCPLTAQNAGMIDAAALAAMKPGVLLLNTARGPLVNEADLAAALRSGQVAGAGLDVVSAEPIDPHNPLLRAPNCILTPHMAWGARAARQRLMDTAVDNLRQFLAGHTVNAVNL